jgi:Na+/H+ antiporter NhaD/arsenite permease-like protein
MQIFTNIPLLVLIAVLILIAVRQVGRIKLQIWHIMLGGAVVVLVAGSITPGKALGAVNIDVMLFLFGMFIVGEALRRSGYLYYLSHKIFRRAKTPGHLILLILFVMGAFSALIMNDTLAIIGTPLVLHFARRHGISARLLLLTLAFAVTIGSVTSPIGNPQNLLIAVNGGVSSPFLAFLRHLALPTIVNLFIAFAVLKIFYRKSFSDTVLNHCAEPISDVRLALLARISLIVILALIAVKIAAVFAGVEFRLTWIALAAAAPIVLFSRDRFRVVRNIDWHTLVFFAAMFVLMQSVWDTHFFENAAQGRDITSIPMILGVSVALSQLISNVPFVALYLPLLKEAHAVAPQMMALAAGSTIAGNLFILGAASNVIIIQNAEKQGETITFLEFARIGIPLTILNTAVYWLFLILL